MQVTVYGAGYVGLVSAVCLAEIGHKVCSFDIDQKKVNMLNQGQLPIYEIGLIELLKKNLSCGNIHFTSDPDVAVEFAMVQIIAVGTPPQKDGTVNLRYVFEAAKTIAQRMTKYCVIVTKSTVPVGTLNQVHNIIRTKLKKCEKLISFDVVSNPEFLKEGTAVSDFMDPDRIIVGVQTKRALKIVRELYAPLLAEDKTLVIMDENSAEFTKYAANAFLATKISFINEMSHLAEKMGADIEQIKRGLGFDKRINIQFLNPGCGFGGSCFPKDVAALQSFARHLDCPAYITSAVLKTNEIQKKILFEKIYHFFNGDLKDKTVALWGLSFKPNTDDVREAPSRRFMELLWSAGAKVQAYDPLAMENIAAIYEQSDQLMLCKNSLLALRNADVLAIVTEWEEFRYPDFKAIKQLLKHPVVFDGRNLYDPKEMNRIGLQYFSIGRGSKEVRCEIMEDLP